MLDLNKNKTGLVVGVFLAALHTIWALIIAIMPGPFQGFLNWVFAIHFLQPIYTLVGFDFVSAILLVVLTFAIGYVYGFLFAVLWNWLHKPRRARRRRR